MSFGFLCAGQRQWIRENPQATFEYLKEMQKQGELMLYEHAFNDALKVIGSGFESVDMLLSICGSESPFLVTKLTSFTILLTNCCQNLHEYSCAQKSNEHALNTLRKLAVESFDNKAKHHYVVDCINAIKHNQEALSFLHVEETPVGEHVH